MFLFVFSDSVEELLLADGSERLEVDEGLLERLLGGVVLYCLDAKVHLVLGGVRDAVAGEHHPGVHQQHVTQGVAQGVVLLVEDEGPAGVARVPIPGQHNQSVAAVGGLWFSHCHDV